MATVHRVINGSVSETVTARPAVPATNTATGTALTVIPARTGTDGTYSFDLPPNDLVTPSGVYWTIYEPGGQVAVMVPPSGSTVPTGGWLVDDIRVDDPAQPGKVSVGLVIPTGTPKGYRPRADGTGGVNWRPDTIDVTDYCVCDGVTDDTAAVFTMLSAAVAQVNATGQCAIRNPGLPIAISGQVYVPRYVDLLGVGGSPDVGVGARFVAVGAQAQVVIHDRGGKSESWLFDGNGIADPTAHTVSVTTHTSTTLNVDVLDGVSNPSDAAIDALWGKIVTLTGATIAGDSLFQSVIVATPGKAGYTGSTSATHTVTLANATAASLSGVTGWFGENIWVHILKPTERQFDSIQVTGAISQVNCQLDKSSNLTWENPKVTKGRFDGLVVGRNGAGLAMPGQCHFSGNGRTQLDFRDDLSAAAYATSRNYEIGHLICETLGALNVRVVEHHSADRVTVDHLSATMNGAIPAFSLGATYTEIPQFNGIGNANIVDYGGNYYQVLKGAGTFVSAATPDVDTTRWELRSDAVSMWYFGSESSAPGQVTNTLTALTVAMQGSSSNRSYGFDGDSDNTSTPNLTITSVLSAQNNTAAIRWNSTTAPIPTLPKTYQTPTVPVMVGAGAVNRWNSLNEPVQLFAASAADLTNSTSPALLSASTPTFAAWKAPAGRMFHVYAEGSWDNIASTGGTFTAKVRINSTVVANAVVAVQETGAGTNSLWDVDLWVVVEATGQTGSILVVGAKGGTIVAAGTQTTVDFTQGGTTVDLRNNLVFDVQGVMSVADPGNKMRLKRGFVQLMP